MGNSRSQLVQFYIELLKDFTTEIASMWTEDSKDGKYHFDIIKAKAKAVEEAKRMVEAIPVHEVLKAELENSISSYVVMYNKNKDIGDKIDFRLKEIIISNPPPDYVSSTGLILEIKENGLWSKVFGKQFNFKHISEARDIKTWGVILYREVFMEFMTAAMNMCIAARKNSIT